ncbi:unnamed protein product [Acanthoscelides obtectus]|uniref:Uncharacterized protein n=1 Tax=Acanthoscelides obtectus TaxID=200917 RepID=A0A9P0K690_ACAOB|nr:unnamed protein product [Acanthoscelides obtectus]CAK1622909.1 hypothetical protein AOBTE_LOCUS1725 [Acanthoscelides obtectus]
MPFILCCRSNWNIPL